MDGKNRFIASLVLLVGFLIAGTIGYMILEDASLQDAMYMTVVTISTVGYSEVFDLSPPGRMFTMILIMAGVGSVYYASVAMVAFLIEGDLRALREKRKLGKQIEKLSGHVVVCGYGRMGSMVVEQVAPKGAELVVIDRDADKAMAAEQAGAFFIRGDATDESILKAAGIDRAGSLVASLPDDAHNVYVTLSAKELQEQLFIIARAEAVESEAKLIRAGADRVVCPQVIGAYRISSLITRPNVVDFYDVAARGVELEIDEYRVDTDSPLAGQSLRDSALRQKVGAMVVTIKRASGEAVFNPSPDEVVQAGDTLIMIGQLHTSRRLAEL